MLQTCNIYNTEFPDKLTENAFEFKDIRIPTEAERVKDRAEFSTKEFKDDLKKE